MNPYSLLVVEFLHLPELVGELRGGVLLLVGEIRLHLTVHGGGDEAKC